MALTGIQSHFSNEKQTPLLIENFIGGDFVQTSNYLDSFDPSTGEVWAKIPDSELKEVDDAVAAARKAFPEYSESIVKLFLAKLIIKLSE